MDPITVAGAWTATKEIFNIGKRILDSKISDEVRKEVQSMIDKSSELYDRIEMLEDERQLNRKTISELQEKIKKTKKFNAEFEKYKPYKFESGTLVYFYDDSVYADKPSHYICTQCVDNSEISILQPKNNDSCELMCHKCNSNYVVRFKMSSWAIF